MKILKMKLSTILDSFLVKNFTYLLLESSLFISQSLPSILSCYQHKLIHLSFSSVDVKHPDSHAEPCHIRVSQGRPKFAPATHFPCPPSCLILCPARLPLHLPTTSQYPPLVFPIHAKTPFLFNFSMYSLTVSELIPNFSASLFLEILMLFDTSLSILDSNSVRVITLIHENIV